MMVSVVDAPSAAPPPGAMTPLMPMTIASTKDIRTPPTEMRIREPVMGPVI